MNRISKWTSLGGVVALAAMLICVACGTSSSSSKVTEMRVVEVAPSAPQLNLLIDNKAVLSAISYGVPTAFVSITAVNHDLKLFDPATSTDLLDNPTESFTRDTSYTYLIVGDQNSSTGIRGNKLVDDHTLADKGNFKLRVVNGSPTLGGVDVYVVAPSSTTDYSTLTPTIGGLASNTASSYQALASGGYQIFITPGGNKTCLQVSSPQIPDQCLVNLNGLNGSSLPTFQAGQNRTLIMVNEIPGGGTYTTLPLLADLN